MGGPGPQLTPACAEWIEVLFGAALREQVASLLLAECGANLPLCESWSSAQLDRIRLGVLKLSDGNLEELKDAIRLAQTDWRDLLVASGFADDPDAHLRWKPQR